ncbi:MAG TPA: hypothetical protein VNK23_03235 [Candidatus Dormibacteraeota bacterium]|nr:hypothetical protein [Candidatus Dormibacteraeota bacterium]
MSSRALLFTCIASLLAFPCTAKQLHHAATSETSDFQRDVELYPEALRAANEALVGSELDSDPHVYTTVVRSAAPGDQQRAAEILEILRHSMAKYKDYRAAIADGYQPFLLKTDQPLYWFISSRNAYASAYEFNPGHPTSLLYKKSKGEFQLAGALFTAPKNATESQLNDRIPLSVARWHEYVNLCVGAGSPSERQKGRQKFGLGGAIATKDACLAAKGRWVPQVFGWMVAIYPFQSDPSSVWPR